MKVSCFVFVVDVKSGYHKKFDNLLRRTKMVSCFYSSKSDIVLLKKYYVSLATYATTFI